MPAPSLNVGPSVQEKFRHPSQRRVLVYSSLGGTRFLRIKHATGMGIDEIETIEEGIGECDTYWIEDSAWLRDRLEHGRFLGIEGGWMFPCVAPHAQDDAVNYCSNLRFLDHGRTCTVVLLEVKDMPFDRPPTLTSVKGVPIVTSPTFTRHQYTVS